jgi:hypothetical protein
MPRTEIEQPNNPQQALTSEIRRTRGLEVKDLRARWRTIFRTEAPPHISHHLLFRLIAFQLQAESFGGLDPECQRVLEYPEALDLFGVERTRRIKIQRGTIFCREWKGRTHRVAVLGDGFAWNGRTYPSLTKVAFAITGTRWNGPRFFGLRDKKPTPKTKT